MSERIARELVRELDELLSQIGFFCRVFGRVKAHHSVYAKILKKNYSANRPLEDYVGVRVTAYFADDCDNIQDLIRQKYVVKSETVDPIDKETFRPVRLNMVCQLGGRHSDEVRQTWPGQPVAPTFEVQIRTVLAEGWYEVEHDLRYKAMDDWEGHDAESRHLNGIMATLETADRGMLMLFEGLAHQHYKRGLWDAMLRHRFRLRIAGNLSGIVRSILESDKDLAKALFRVDRQALIGTLMSMAVGGTALPLTADNVCFIALHVAGTANQSWLEYCPELVLQALGLWDQTKTSRL
jgi:putative GTP pyrophosphokinase